MPALPAVVAEEVLEIVVSDNGAPGISPTAALDSVEKGISGAPGMFDSCPADVGVLDEYAPADAVGCGDIATGSAP